MSPSLHGLRTVIYPAPDLDAAKAWWTEFLSAEPYFDQPSYVGYNVAGYELGLLPDGAPGDGALTYWGVDDVAGAVRAAIEAGSTEHTPPSDVGDGIVLGQLLRPRERARLRIIVEHEESSMPTNKEIIAAAYASFAKGDVPSVLAVMDPKIEWTEAEGWPLYSGTLVGPQAVVDGVFMRLGEIGENFSVNVTQLVAEGDTVVGLGTYSWNRKGSGEPAEVKIAHVWTLASGKVTRFQQHVDTAKERYLIA